MKKKLIKAGIASAMICTVLGSTVVPTSAKEVPVDTAKEVTKIAEEVTPRFMYTQTCTSQQKLDTNFKYYLSINLISVQYGASFATFLSG